MSRIELSPSSSWYTRQGPWVLVSAAFGSVGLALGLSQFDGDWKTIQGPLVLLGLLLAGTGIIQRLQTTPWDLEDRLISATLVTLGGLASLAGSFALDPSWDSMVLFLRVLTGVALGGAGLILLPLLGRKVVISFLVLFHFGGIVTAVTAVDPPNSQAPWISQQLWARVFRPYLEFMYLNNAYHFYSPDPGPAQLLWFRLEYTDNSYRWYKIPNRRESPIGMHYQRMLSITESTNGKIVQTPPDFSRRLANYWKLLRNLNREGADQFEMQNPVGNLLYQVATPYAQNCISSYARFVARKFPHPEPPEGDPNATLRCIEIYRVTHQIILPPEMARGGSPLDKGLFAPYFMGEFDSNGKLKDPNDPAMHWLFPIAVNANPTGQAREINFLELLASQRALTRQRKAEEGDQP